MAGFQRSVFIARRPEEVFAFASDPGNVSKWIPAITRIEVLTEGPIRAGTKFRETRCTGKREAQVIIEVTVHDPPRRHSAGASFPGGEAAYHYTFQPEGDGTRVELTAEVRGRWLGWLLVPLLVGVMKKQDGEQLAQLKAAIEGG